MREPRSVPHWFAFCVYGALGAQGVLGCAPPTQANWLVPIAPGAEARLCARQGLCGAGSVDAPAASAGSPLSAALSAAPGTAQATIAGSSVRASVGPNTVSFDNGLLRVEFAGCPVHVAGSSARAESSASVQTACEPALCIAANGAACVRIALRVAANAEHFVASGFELGRAQADAQTLRVLGSVAGRNASTRVTLRSEDRGIAMEHEFAQDSAQVHVEAQLPAPARAFVLGRPLGFVGAATSAFVASIGADFSLVFASVSDDMPVTSTAEALSFEPVARGIAGGGTRAEWVLLAGKQADTASAMAEVWRAAGTALTQVDIALDAADERVIVAQANGAEFLAATAHARAEQACAVAALELPAGRYRVRSSSWPRSRSVALVLGEQPQRISLRAPPAPQAASAAMSLPP